MRRAHECTPKMNNCCMSIIFTVHSHFNMEHYCRIVEAVSQYENRSKIASSVQCADFACVSTAGMSGTA